MPEARLWRSPHLIITNVHLQHKPVREKYSVGRLINAHFPAVSLSKSAAAVSCDARVCPNTLNR